MSASNYSNLYNSYARIPLNFTHGKGAYLYSDTAQEYLDFTSGIAVTGLGHAHPYLNAALEKQAKTLWHTSNLFTIELQEKLAARLCNISFADKVFFANSGTEAVECAIKTARRYHFTQGNNEKNTIVSFCGAFHGRTIAALAATGNKKYLEGFDPKAPGFVQFSPQLSMNELKQQLQTISRTLAAIIIEPIQGEGGVNVIPDDMLQFLRSFCDANNCLLIFDEVQTGIGRTGSVFAYQHSGVKPDLMCLAKGLGNGFPIGACLGTAAVASAITPGTHGSTFGGNLLAMAVANAVLDLILQPDFLAQATEISSLLYDELGKIAHKHSTIIEAIHGRGFLLGIKAKIPNEKLITACRNNKLLTLGGGNNVMRILPPLNITKEHVEQAIHRLDKACTDLQT
ncbi:aspartate aminotransferase family protein [Bartonella sp. TP]|uniref:aspartate aminotransferase family protein n=1 Tax=Bartonella sp. TP TaxID=3057550 RepID=UPI0025B026D3|nr:aspartate aminotransferase family protein [Bartonella sp. TP]MDN5248619.1 aspartate aminotransferase family protein [Alphaproteobacteria bacterium]WJW80426.1 aspartate aminotransferase family protein [Bartonella sp. TP]